jgi:hypothetical protein
MKSTKLVDIGHHRDQCPLTHTFLDILLGVKLDYNSDKAISNSLERECFFLYGNN